MQAQELPYSCVREKNEKAWNRFRTRVDECSNASEVRPQAPVRTKAKHKRTYAFAHTGALPPSGAAQ